MAMTLFRVAGPASGQIPPGEGLVETTGVVSVDGVHPGSRFKAAVVVRLTDDWHVNAHEPTLDYLIPTGLPPLVCPHPELGCGCGERLGDRFRYGWTIA